MRLPLLRATALSVLLAASGVTLLAGAPAAQATCTVNLGSCSPESTCTVNTATCQYGGACTVNVGANQVTATDCRGGRCDVNVVARCSGDCDVNVATTVGACAGGASCTVNAVSASCWGSCDVNVDADCIDSACTVNVAGGWCRPGGRCVVNALSVNGVDCTDDCTVMMEAACYFRLWPTLAFAQDLDFDGVGVVDEVLGHSDPTSPASRPDTDDDGDGVPNRDEQSRAHAMGALTQPRVRASAADHVWLHFGLPGGTASLTSPAGATMRVTYVPSPGSGCPLPLPRPAPEVLHDCALPAVVKVGLDGRILEARGAFEPGVGVPASAFVVTCTPAPLGLLSGPCLVGAAVDGTWVLAPGQQAPRVSTQVRAPAGMLVSVQGKAFDDVAPDSADIATTGSGQNSRDATMPLRLWNWHKQAPGTTYSACSGGLVAPCLTEGPAEENVAYATVFVGA